MGTWAAIPGLVELLAAIEGVWIVCWLLPRPESHIARGGCYVGALLLSGAAMLADPQPYPGMSPIQWYARVLLHVQETGMLAIAAGYVATRGSYLPLGKHDGNTISPSWCHAVLLCVYFSVDAWAGVAVQSNYTMLRWISVDRAMMAVHLACDVAWLPVLHRLRLGARPRDPVSAVGSP
jgi:hypothetical protein